MTHSGIIMYTISQKVVTIRKVELRIKKETLYRPKS